MSGKVFVIGLDGVTFKLIRPWVAQGLLPNFARLMQEGVFGELLSTPDMLSPAAWTSFATGRNPGSHGIFNFMDMVPGTLKLRYLNSRHREGETIWSVLSDAGKKVGMMNIPMTYPADEVNGFMISGWNAPGVRSPGFTYPPGLVDELLERHGDYPLFPTVKKHMAAGNPELAVRELNHNLDINFAATRDLMERRPWDFFATVVIATDQVQHYFWRAMDPGSPGHTAEEAARYGDTILGVYRRCDAFIGELLEKLDDDTTLIVMSDHGAGKNHGAVKYLPLWLQALGLATQKQVSHSLLSRSLKGVYQALNTHLSVRLKHLLNTLLPALRDRVETAWRFDAYEWDKTKVFFHYEPRVNLRGREPHGIVAPGKEYEEVRDFVIAKLFECRDLKTGEPLVERVFKGEEVFHGAHAAEAPDLVIWWRDVAISGMVCPGEHGDIVVSEEYVEDIRSGHHTPYGVLLARGPRLKRGVEITGARIIDLAPTILHLMGETPPGGMDGEILGGIFREELQAGTLPPERGGAASGGKEPADYSDRDAEAIQQRLGDLGYL